MSELPMGHERCIGCGETFEYDWKSESCVDLTPDLVSVGLFIRELSEHVPEVPDDGLYWCTMECFARWAARHAAEEAER